MWNTTQELARIRRQELLDEAREERLARIAREGKRDQAAGHRAALMTRPRPAIEARSR